MASMGGSSHKIAAKEGRSENFGGSNPRVSLMVGTNGPSLKDEKVDASWEFLITSCFSDGVNTQLGLLLGKSGSGALGFMSAVIKMFLDA